MHRYLYPTLVLIALALGYFWFKSHDRANALAEARADSIDFVMSQAESTFVAQDSVRAVLLDSVRALERESTIFRARTEILKVRSDSLLSALDIQLYTEVVSDSTRVAIFNAVDVLQDQIWTCEQAHTNCERRVSLLSNRLAQDTVLLAQARRNANEMAQLYSAELRKHKKSTISVGFNVGFGAVYSQGSIYAGPSVSFGVSLNLFSIGG